METTLLDEDSPSYRKRTLRLLVLVPSAPLTSYTSMQVEGEVFILGKEDRGKEAGDKIIEMLLPLLLKWPRMARLLRLLRFPKRQTKVRWRAMESLLALSSLMKGNRRARDPKNSQNEGVLRPTISTSR